MLLASQSQRHQPRGWAAEGGRGEAGRWCGGGGGARLTARREGGRGWGGPCLCASPFHPNHLITPLRRFIIPMKEEGELYLTLLYTFTTRMILHFKLGSGVSHFNGGGGGGGGLLRGPKTRTFEEKSGEMALNRGLSAYQPLVTP